MNIAEVFHRHAYMVECWPDGFWTYYSADWRWQTATYSSSRSVISITTKNNTILTWKLSVVPRCQWQSFTYTILSICKTMSFYLESWFPFFLIFGRIWLNGRFGNACKSIFDATALRENETPLSFFHLGIWLVRMLYRTFSTTDGFSH